MKFPEIKKTVKSFLLGEEGKISKQSMLKIGMFVVGSAAFSAKSVSAGHDSHIDCSGCNQYTDNHFNGHVNDSDGFHANCRVNGAHMDGSNNNEDCPGGFNDKECGINQHANAVDVNSDGFIITAEHDHHVSGDAHCDDHGNKSSWVG